MSGLMGEVDQKFHIQNKNNQSYIQYGQVRDGQQPQQGGHSFVLDDKVSQV